MAWIEKIAQQSWRVRYRRDDGHVESIYGFTSEKAAQDYGDMVDCDRRRGTWLDPSGYRTTVADWVERWFPTLDLDTRTLENYTSYLRCHILPHFGTTPLGAITPLDIRLWTKQALEDGYAPATVSGWTNLLSMIFADAVDQRLIPANPIHKHRRRGRRSRQLRPERIWATPEQVLRVANQAGMLGGPIARLLIITAGWTGCRWGELAGLHRRNVDLHRGVITVDAWHGALHESNGQRWIGPPKTASSARRIHLPPFLVELLRKHLDSHPHEYVFTTESGTWLWRSTFARRILRPAADGNLDIGNPTVRTYPTCPGLTFHGLRHSHNTWMITDDIPDIARARRLGHHLDNRTAETYSHVSGELHQRLLTSLEHRWHTAAATTTTASAPVTEPPAAQSATPRNASPTANWKPDDPTNRIPSTMDSPYDQTAATPPQPVAPPAHNTPLIETGSPHPSRPSRPTRTSCAAGIARKQSTTAALTSSSRERSRRHACHPVRQHTPRPMQPRPTRAAPAGPDAEATDQTPSTTHIRTPPSGAIAPGLHCFTRRRMDNPAPPER